MKDRSSSRTCSGGGIPTTCPSWWRWARMSSAGCWRVRCAGTPSTGCCSTGTAPSSSTERSAGPPRPTSSPALSHRPFAYPRPPLPRGRVPGLREGEFEVRAGPAVRWRGSQPTSHHVRGRVPVSGDGSDFPRVSEHGHCPGSTSDSGEIMSLLLIETTTPPATSAPAFLEEIGSVAASSGAGFVEAQVTTEGDVFAIIDPAGASREAVLQAFGAAGIALNDHADVRLVGADLDEIKAAKPAGDYLVEWDIPAGVTMDAYLQRKAEKSPLYANVPEVSFLRTYVREDMVKCLCFYDGDDEAAVRRARAAV